ncbi:MAG: hypothetical protein ACTTK0_02835 [Stomatobaculum sp.]
MMKKRIVAILTVLIALLMLLFYRDKEFFNFDGFEERASHDTHPNLLIRYLLNLWRNIKATGLYFLSGVVVNY